MTRRIVERVAAHLRGYESFRARWYRCEAGVWTIGYGHTSAGHRDKSTGEWVDTGEYSAGKWPNGMTKDAALALFRFDLDRYERAVDETITAPLGDNQFGACVCLAFNIGTDGFRTSTVAKIINLYGDGIALWPAWAAWHHAKGKDSAGLKLRRAREYAMFWEPDPAPDGPSDEQVLAAIYASADAMVADARATVPDREP
jgi:lysozyme